MPKSANCFTYNNGQLNAGILLCNDAQNGRNKNSVVSMPNSRYEIQCNTLLGHQPKIEFMQFNGEEFRIILNATMNEWQTEDGKNCRFISKHSDEDEDIYLDIHSKENEENSRNNGIYLLNKNGPDEAEGKIYYQEAWRVKNRETLNSLVKLSPKGLLAIVTNSKIFGIMNQGGKPVKVEINPDLAMAVADFNTAGRMVKTTTASQKSADETFKLQPSFKVLTKALYLMVDSLETIHAAGYFINKGYNIHSDSFVRNILDCKAAGLNIADDILDFLVNNRNLFSKESWKSLEAELELQPAADASTEAFNQRRLKALADFKSGKSPESPVKKKSSKRSNTAKKFYSLDELAIEF